ncbi:MAG TPA: hypothetical protein PKA02_03870 [Candidatus Saccharibacteria bacterium]|nr:hypothetical protein [Candidatus Saccharibacteria bacterium]
MVKKFFSGLSSSMLAVCVILLAITSILVLQFRPPHIKNWLRSSGIYATLPDYLVGQASKASSGADSAFFGDPGVQAAAKQAVTPVFLEQTGGQIIDGSFQWLDGKTEKPSFSIDLQPQKVAFASGLSSYLKTRYLSLPACPPRSIPTSTELLKITCRPAFGFDVDAEIAKLTSTIVSSDNFLPQVTLSADTFQAQANDGTKEPVYQRFQQVKRVYSYVRLVPVALGFMSILLIAIIMLGFHDHRRAAKKIGVTLVMSGLLLGVGAALERFIAPFIKTNVAKGNLDTTIRTALEKGIDAFIHDLTKQGFIASGLITLCGALVLLSLQVVSRRSVVRASAPETPQSQS